MAYFRVPTTDKVKGLLNRRGRLEKIIDLVSSLPSSPNQGDRYVDLSDNKVKEYDGSVWQEYVPNEGDNLYVLNRDKYYYFDGTEWKDLTEIVSQWDKSGDTLTPKDADNIEINGSFIGDGSQLTGIKKLIEEFVAQGNVSAGDVVAFVNGKAKKGKTVNSLDVNIGDLYVFNSGNLQYIYADYFDESKFIIVFYDGTTNYKTGVAVIGKIQGSGIVFGSLYNFENSGNFVDYPSVAVVDVDKAVIAYTDYDNNRVGAVVLATVNDTEINFSNKYVFDSNHSYHCYIKKLEQNKFVIVYNDDSNNGYIIAGDVSSGSFNFGSKYVFSSDNVFAQPCVLSPTRVAISFRNSSNEGVGVTCDISDSSVSVNQEFVIENQYTVYAIMCDALDENCFVVSYRQVTNNLGVCKVVYIDQNGVGTVGNENIFSNDLIVSYIVALDNSTIAIVYRESNNICYTVAGKVNSFEVDFGVSEVVSSGATEIGVCYLSRAKYVSFIEKLAGNASICELPSTSLSYIGISQETKNDGETTKVLIQGVSDVHSGLTVGQKYYADENGNLTTTETEDYIGIAISENKILLLDWQRPIMIYDGSNDEYIVPEKI